MKSLTYFFILFLIILSACNKREKMQTVIVIHDCMGQYLRFENKDYPICNIETVENIESGTLIKATFKEVDGGFCKDRDRGIHCMVPHGYPLGGYYIKVIKIE